MLKHLFLFLMIAALTSACGIVEQFDGDDDTANLAESDEPTSAELLAIDDSGEVLIIMPVAAFVNDAGDFGTSSFDIALNGIAIATAQSASDHYVFDNQQIVTAYSEVQYRLDGVSEGDTITITITNAGGATITLEGTASADEDTVAGLI